MVICITVGMQPAGAAPPWTVLMPFKRIEADPDKSYVLTEEDGPWMVLASTFAGPGADREAHQLVFELRRRYKLVAYVHKKHFDYSRPVTGLGLDRYGGPKRMRYQQQGAYDEWAVLVGDFESVDHPALEKTLKKIKYARPECLQVGPDQPTTQRFAGWRALQRRINSDLEKKKKGPMGHAFITRNPLPPQEYFAPKGPDKFVLEMNKGVPHSLLDCPGKYSVRVATFRGSVVIDQRKIKDINSGAHMTSQLEQAAVKARKLTEALRAQGVEAYEFHDRHESIVTIGSFDSVGSPRPDGKININPAIQHIMNSYGAQRRPIAGAGLVGLQPVTLAGIPFDVQPLPVEVPRYSVGSDYARGKRLWQ